MIPFPVFVEQKVKAVFFFVKPSIHVTFSLVQDVIEESCCFAVLGQLAFEEAG